jgi:hypothetical protein
MPCSLSWLIGEAIELVVLQSFNFEFLPSK